MAGVILAYQSDPDEAAFAAVIRLRRGSVCSGENLQEPAAACQTAFETSRRLGTGAA
jgi:hypothetical protein